MLNENNFQEQNNNTLIQAPGQMGRLTPRPKNILHTFALQTNMVISN